MEFVRPNVEIWEQGTTLEDMWKHIARCTRVCYQSIPKNDGETDEEFVKRVILRPDSSTGRLNFDKIHGSMLEHYTIYLTLPITNVLGDEVDLTLVVIADRYRHNKYSKVISSDKYVYVTTNLRVIYENNWLNDLEYIDIPTFHHKRVTVSFTINIGVSREFNRHRVNSIAEESTRYCNYSKKNDGQLKIGLPAWLLDDEHLLYLKRHSVADIEDYANGILNQESDELASTWCDIDFYLCALTFSQWCYNMLIKKGWSAQKAREVLPLATKSQLIHTAFIDDWKHFFALRADGVSGTPHPNAKLVAEPLKQEFIKRGLL